MSNAERIGATDVSDLFCDGLALLSRGCCIACIILSSSSGPPSPRPFPLWISAHLFGKEIFGKNGFSECLSHASSEDWPFGTAPSSSPCLPNQTTTLWILILDQQSRTNGPPFAN